MTTLSNSDKIAVIDQKIKSIEYQKYSLEIDISLENQVESPSQISLDSLQQSLDDINAKLSFLESEKALLQ